MATSSAAALALQRRWARGGRWLAGMLAACAAPAWAAPPAATACFDETDRSGYAQPDVEGRWQGATVALVQALAREAGVALTLRPLPWARCLRLAKSAGPDAVDFAFYASDSRQRRADYAFLGPIHHVTGGVWFLGSRTELPHTLASYAALDGHRLCGIAGANYAWMKDVGVEGRVDAGAHNLRAAVTKLLLGRCDYLLGAANLGAIAARNDILPAEMARLRFAPYPRPSAVSYYLLFNRQPAGGAQLLEAFTAAFEQLSRSGAVERLYREHGLAP